MSTCLALEALGCKCAHMKTILEKDESAVWIEILTEIRAGRRVSEALIKRALKDHDACVDTPWCFIYRELMEMFPKAPVLLNVRDADKWVQSVVNTVGAPHELTRGWLGRLFVALNRVFNPRVARTMDMQRLFWKHVGVDDDASIHDPATQAHMKKWFLDWNAKVEASVPRERLTVFRVEEGWAPLCKALDVPVPAKPFPNVNDTPEMQRRMRVVRLVFYGWPLFCIASMCCGALAIKYFLMK